MEHSEIRGKNELVSVFCRVPDPPNVVEVFKFDDSLIKIDKNFPIFDLGNLYYRTELITPNSDCFLCIKFGEYPVFIRVGSPIIRFFFYGIEEGKSIQCKVFNAINGMTIDDCFLTDIGKGFYQYTPLSLGLSIIEVMGIPFLLKVPYIYTYGKSQGSLILQNDTWQLIALPTETVEEEQALVNNGFLDQIVQLTGRPSEDSISVCNAYIGGENKFRSFVPGITPIESEHNFPLIYTDTSNGKNVKEITGFWVKTKNYKAFYPEDLVINWNTSCEETYIIDVNFSADPAVGEIPLTVSFTDYTSSTYAIDSWSWDLGMDMVSSEQNPSITYMEVGEYDITLMVKDVMGHYASITKRLYIKVNTYLKFEGSPTIGTYPLEVDFSASTSLPKTIIKHSWTFGDGNFSKDASPSNIYERSGVYHVSLEVTYDDNTTDSLTKRCYLKVMPEFLVVTPTNARSMEEIRYGELYDFPRSNWHWVFRKCSEREFLIESFKQYPSNYFSGTRSCSINAELDVINTEEDKLIYRAFLDCVRIGPIPSTRIVIGARSGKGELSIPIYFRPTGVNLYNTSNIKMSIAYDPEMVIPKYVLPGEAIGTNRLFSFLITDSEVNFEIRATEPISDGVVAKLVLDMLPMEYRQAKDGVKITKYLMTNDSVTAQAWTNPVIIGPINLTEGEEIEEIEIPITIYPEQTDLPFIYEMDLDLVWNTKQIKYTILDCVSEIDWIECTGSDSKLNIRSIPYLEEEEEEQVEKINALPSGRIGYFVVSVDRTRSIKTNTSILFPSDILVTNDKHESITIMSDIGFVGFEE